jgi:hypothetical protein
VCRYSRSISVSASHAVDYARYFITGQRLFCKTKDEKEKQTGE